MLTVTLPDGAQKQFESAVTVHDVAASIGAGLAGAALAGRVNGELVDTSHVIDSDAAVAIVTGKDEDGLEVIRHSCAHLMAQAVQRLFPTAQVTIGPTIEDGFFYDFAYDRPFTPEDLEQIEKEMSALVSQSQAVTRSVMSRQAAVALFEEKGEHYKVEILKSIPDAEDLSFYQQGDFVDLCRGPHVPDTGRIKAFKLTKVAGAYWRGDSNNPMLQRIYGTAWLTEKDLAAYLHMIEEAEKRDHRKLGRQLDLFHLQEEAAGSVFWHPKGWTLYREIEQYMRRRLEASDYVEVKTPQLVDKSLWEASGHWEKFGENIFTSETNEDKILALKPMNCPGHVQIYRQGVKSYRDLPYRMAEFGSCHRNEPSGALHGIMRVRAFTQDDAHIFCTEDQINSETVAFCNLLQDIYADFGFTDVRVKFSDRPEVRAGDDATWDKAEAALMEATEAAGLETILNPGEGAFYGPKLEFVLRDAIGRDWQCGTLQMDFVLPERLDAEYVAEDGVRKRPVMLHRAILGSLERWIGIVIEQYSGRMPPWLSPVQVVVAAITDQANDYAETVAAAAAAAGLRVHTDIRNEKIGYKIREHSTAKVPFILAVGGREAEAGTVALRRLGSDGQTILDCEEAMRQLALESCPPDLKTGNA